MNKLSRVSKLTAELYVASMFPENPSVPEKLSTPEALREYRLAGAGIGAGLVASRIPTRKELAHAISQVHWPDVAHTESARYLPEADAVLALLESSIKGES